MPNDLNTEEIDYQKLRGGYYTPPVISQFLADWAIRRQSDTILEPSCGDGAILLAAADRLSTLGASPVQISRQLQGIEIDPEEAEKTRVSLSDFGLPQNEINVVAEDFFSFRAGGNLFSEGTDSQRRYDAVIGNPPFIRYQNFPDESRTRAFEQMNRVGLNPNGHTNMWVPFLVLSALMLSDEGRFGMVIPAELFQVKYAAETRKFLSRYFDQLTLITFEKLIFEGIQQEVILLLGEKGTVENEGIRLLELNDAHDLASYQHSDISSVEVKPLDHSKEKWTQYHLESDEIELLRRMNSHPEIIRTGEVYDVSVGVVTGKNDFFILDKNEVEDLSIQDATTDIVTRSGHLEGAIFEQRDWTENANSQRSSKLFQPEDAPKDELPTGVQSYINQGEKERHHTGYKCRTRDPWYIVPSVWIPDAFMLRQVHSYPKLILNRAEATCTDTIHRVKFYNGWREKDELVTGAFLNSLTFATAEVKGRSYGGGVLTFEPSEGEDLPLPLKNSEKLDLNRIDQLIRKNEIEAVLDMNDQILLIDGLDLNKKDVSSLRRIWKKMRDRRINRG